MWDWFFIINFPQKLDSSVVVLKFNFPWSLSNLIPKLFIIKYHQVSFLTPFCSILLVIFRSNALSQMNKTFYLFHRQSIRNLKLFCYSRLIYCNGSLTFQSWNSFTLKNWGPQRAFVYVGYSYQYLCIIN